MRYSNLYLFKTSDEEFAEYFVSYCRRERLDVFTSFQESEDEVLNVMVNRVTGSAYVVNERTHPKHWKYWKDWDSRHAPPNLAGEKIKVQKLRNYDIYVFWDDEPPVELSKRAGVLITDTYLDWFPEYSFESLAKELLHLGAKKIKGLANLRTARPYYKEKS